MIGKRLRYATRIVFLSLLIQGCAANYRLVEFEILEPATVEFPEQVERLVFLNRAPITFDIWAEQNQVDMDAAQLVVLDTLIINNLFRGVLDMLRQSPSEKFHFPIWLSDRRSDTTGLEDLILTRREVDHICDTIMGDVIISLEFYSAGIDQHFDYYRDAPDDILNHYYELSNRLRWNIYLPGMPRPFDTYNMADTLYFPLILDGEFLNFTPGVDMLRQMFYESGRKYGNYLVPVWNKASRILYSGRNDSLKLAIEHTDEGDWEGAFSIWKELSSSEDSTLSAMAYHNMAVYFELEDKLDSAQMMLDLGLEKNTLELDTLYRDELDVRILNRQDILKQVR